nr:beta-ketoacyl-ACP synthase II [Anaerolineae bacterium]
MKRVVITGMGAISSLGHSVAENWQAALNGRSGAGPITLFDDSALPNKVAAEVKNLDPTQYLDRREVRRLDRYQWLALIAAQEALTKSGLEISDSNRTRIGVAVCSGVGGLRAIEDETIKLYNEGPRRLSPFAIPQIMTNGASSHISIKYGLQGPSFCVTSACASASDGIGVASQFIRSGIVDVMIAGGAESGITLFGISAFQQIGAYSQKTTQTPSPFSRDRDGLIMGEGSAVLVLESLDHARLRGATILAELSGYGISADAFHITAPSEDGSGSAIAINRALTDAHLNPEDIDYVNAHGTGTLLNDAAETKSLKQALGQAAYSIPISSTKSMTGHLMGASAALEAVFAVKAIEDNAVPPTINYNEPDPECDLDYVPNTAREYPVRQVLSNSFGFGGHNSALIFSNFEG